MTTFPSAKKNRQLLSTIDLLYDAVCDLDRWPAFLAAASTLFEAQGCQIGHFDLSNHALSFDRIHGYDWDTDHYQKYSELMSQDPRLSHFSSNPFKAIHCRMFMAQETWHQSRVYREVCMPGNVEYSLGVNLDEEALSLTYFLALRTKKQPVFNSRDCATLEQLVPHLRRALLLQRELGKVDFESDISNSALDAMPTGIVAVTSDMRIKLANVAARAIFDRQDGISSDHGKFHTSFGQRDLKQAVQRLILQTSTEKAAACQTQTVHKLSGSTYYNLLITPIWGNHLRFGWKHIREPLALLVIHDPDHADESRSEVISRLFKLTPSQTRMACLICDGNSIQEASCKLGIAESTGRQYVKSVFSKMGVNRQSEMVRKILNIPQSLKSVVS